MSEAATYYWVHQVTASLLLGLAGFVAGFLAGALIWGTAAVRARRRWAQEAAEEPEAPCGNAT